MGLASWWFLNCSKGSITPISHRLMVFFLSKNNTRPIYIPTCQIDICSYISDICFTLDGETQRWPLIVQIVKLTLLLECHLDLNLRFRKFKIKLDFNFQTPLEAMIFAKLKEPPKWINEVQNQMFQWSEWLVGGQYKVQWNS